MMHKYNRAYFRFLANSQQAAAKLATTVMLLSAVLLHSPLADAEQTASAFKNVIDKVSRSGSLLMLQAVCDRGKAEISDGIARCAICPSYTSAPDKTTGFELANAVLGSFTQAREPEALLYMTGCESDATEDGGIVLLQNTAHGWSRLQYQRGFGFSECLKFRTLDDVSNLLCNHSALVDGNQIGTISWIDLTENKFSRETLLRWYDNTASNPRELVSVFPYRFLRSDFNQDGRGDVRISFRIREQVIPEKFPGALDAINSGYNIAPPESLSLTYLFNGVALKLQKGSQENAARINQIVNKHLPTTDR